MFGSLRAPLAGRRGAFAECVVANSDELAAIPGNVSDTLAAALPIAGASAVQCLELGGVKTGSDVMVVGATGGVGSFATILGAANGARITAVCRIENAGYASALGAAAVLPYDRCSPLEAAATYDVIIDLAAAYSPTLCRARLRPSGSYVVTAGSPRQLLAQWRARLFGGPAAHALMVRVSRPILGQLASIAAQGGFAALAISALPFGDLVSGLERSAQGHHRGKLVVQM